jgi:ATP/ADP translocase
MNIALPRIHAAEALRFGLIVALFFFNSVILESNEVIATSGFISNIGVQYVVWVWAADMIVVMVTAALYSIVVDRTNRAKLTTRMFGLFGCIYIGLFGLFYLGHVTWLAYPLLTIINDQQWSLFGLLIWALANDSFSTAQAKRLFPLLAMAIMIGSVVGNATVTLLPQLLHVPGYMLLLFNALLMLSLFLVLSASLAKAGSTAHLFSLSRSTQQAGDLRTIFTEGLGFIRDVPAFRYLAFAMIPLGFGLNALEFHFLSTIVHMDGASVQTIYGTFKIVLSLTVLLVQGLFVTQLINTVGLRRIFSLLPLAQVTGLLLVFMWPLYGIFLGNYLTRVALVAVDEPARQMLFGLVPDERRGRVSAFMNGYLYPLGAILSCIVIGLSFMVRDANALAPHNGQLLYLGQGALAVLFALTMSWYLQRSYDTSLLSWRLDRRKRRSTIPNLDF